MANEFLHEESKRNLTETASPKDAEGAASKQSEERLSQFLHGLSIAAFVINDDHVITHCTRAFESLTGIPAAELVGTSNQWKTFYPTKRPTLADLIVDHASEDEIAKYYQGNYRKSALIEGAYEMEVFLSRAGLADKWLFLTAAPLWNDTRRITGAIETLQDITDRKHTEQALRRSERRQRALLDFAPYPITVSSLDGHVSYLNPAFTEAFGWTIEELEGKVVPFVPPGRGIEIKERIKRFIQERVIMRFETQRLTKDGRILDVVIKAALFSEANKVPAGIISILRDVTHEKRMTRNNEAMLRISMALPEYPDLQDLLYYVNCEVKGLLCTEGAITVLSDEFRDDLFVLGAAYDDMATEKRVQEFRFSRDQLVAGEVIRTGEPIIISDTSIDFHLHEERDKKFGYQTKNLVVVPLKSSERIIGALCGINKEKGIFDQSDVELLNMIAGTVALSIANARFSNDLKTALRTNEALLSISMALPKYPALEGLLDYVNSEIKRLLESEGAVVLLVDEEKQEFYALGAAYDATDTQKRVKEVRFSMDQLMAGRVLKTGEPMIVSDTSKESHLHEERDKKLGYKTRNLVLVPLKNRDRTTGVLCAINKKAGDFAKFDVELLSLIGGTVALSIENARVSEELRKAYKEVTSMNRAKDKAINHLSHELKTPLAIITSSLMLLTKKLQALPESTWISTVERIKRNLDRIIEIQYEVNDIMEDRQPKAYALLSLLLDQCADEIQTLIAEQGGEDPLLERVRKRIEDLFGPREAVPKQMNLGEALMERLDALRPLFSQREVNVITRIDPAPAVLIPPDVLQKIVDGLIKNAIENTPDEGKLEASVRKRGDGAVLEVHDYGVGIPEGAQQRIFEGFFTTQDTMAYSSRRPFDFNAGGKGADLLRMKIFSERYHFDIEMVSMRCRFIPNETDVCPGRITKCHHCSRIEDCHDSGGTTLVIYFSPASSPRT